MDNRKTFLHLMKGGKQGKKSRGSSNNKTRIKKDDHRVLADKYKKRNLKSKKN